MLQTLLVTLLLVASLGITSPVDARDSEAGCIDDLGHIRLEECKECATDPQNCKLMRQE